MKKSTILGVTLLILFVAGGLLLADYYRSSPEAVDAGYIGRDSCIKCHQAQAVAFEGSDHDLAMDLATDESVVADFDNIEIEHYGITSRLFRDGDKFMVHTEGPDGKMQDFQIKYVFGVRPLQQYMVEIARPTDAKSNEIGTVQVLRLSWDTLKKKWFYLTPPDVDEKIDPNDPLHWTGITQNWNASCASCHSTNVHKNFDTVSGSYHTTFSEIDVSCEACHGPGSFHVELANRKSLFWDRKHGLGLAKLKVESNVPQVEACAPCHSRRGTISESFQPSCNFDDYFAINLIEKPIYHADGQVRGEDYVYGSFIQSKMYHNGVKCTDCHDPHTTKVKFNDNTLCTSCHLGKHPAGQYDTTAHHHHAPGTPGSFCIDCHMPATTYMTVDSRRDHSFRVPRPDLSLKLGTPNACTGCHLKEEKLVDRVSELPLTQYLDWILAAEQGDKVVAAELKRVNSQMKTATDEWYADSEAEPSVYYEHLATGLSNEMKDINKPADSLLKLANDRKVPAMIRASALTGLATNMTDESFQAALKALDDPDTKVVASAIRRIDSEVSRLADRLQYLSNAVDIRDHFRSVATALVPLFTHPAIRVRTEAARVFATLDKDSQQKYTTPRDRKNFTKAIGELKTALMIESDRGATHMMLGGIHELMGDFAQAKTSYATAIRIDPYYTGPRANLAALLDAEVNGLQQQLRSSQQGGIQAGQLKTMMTQMQALRTQAAQLRAEEHQLLATDLRRSRDLANTHGLHYRFAMSSYVQRDLEGCIKHLKIAHEQAPEIPTYHLGLATFFLQLRQPDEAQPFIDLLLKQAPNHTGYQNLNTQAEAMRKSQPK